MSSAVLGMSLDYVFMYTAVTVGVPILCDLVGPLDHEGGVCSIPVVSVCTNECLGLPGSRRASRPIASSVLMQ